MTAPIAPLRATSFEGLIFFVYDREAVTKEEDPPENAIVYFYPPSASIEDRISICGQLIGMSHFIHGFIGSRPALCKLQTEKVATVHSGKYTLALGGSLDEPDSLLIRQLETLHSLFTFYHGSLERIRLMCENQNQFLSWMNVIWDCYLHFVRHYGDFLPGVFDPLPFLNLSKNVAATCFTKASYILQACQRRKHILGGCILYSNSILCTQLEPAITERLILLKPNQSNHPARPVKTGHDLPFGVRILNAFLTLSEYLNLYDALAQSAYRQPDSPDSTGAFPDMYMTFSPLVTKRKSPGQGSGHKPQRMSSDGGTNSSESLSRETSSQRNNPEANSTENVPSDIAGDEVLQATKERKDSEIVHHREPILKPGSGVLSEKKYKDAQGVHEIAKETRKKQRFAGISSLSSETRKSPAEHRKTTVEEMEKAFESRVDGLIAKNSIVEAEATTSLADKKCGQEQTGNGAGARTFEKTGEKQFEGNESAFLARKKSKEEQHESTAIGVKAERKIAGIKNGSVTSAFLTLTQNEGEARDSFTKKNGEGKQNRSEASVRKVEKSTGEERNTSEEVVLDKTENNAGGTIDVTIYSNTSFVDSSCGRSLGEISWLKTVLNCSTAFDSSSCESCVSNDASLTMEAIEVSELKVIEDINSQFDKLSTDGSNSCTAKSQENEDIGICKLVLEEVITQVCEIAEKTDSQNGPVESDITSKSKLCCQACVDARKSRGFCAESRKSGDDSFQNLEAWEMEQNGHEKEMSGPCWETDHSSVDCVQDKKSRTHDCTDSGGRICDGQPKRPGPADTRDTTDGYSKKDHSLRGNLVKTPIVCESFSARNLNSRSPEKFVEKDFTCTGIEVLKSERADSMSTSDTEVADGIPVAALENEHTERGNSATWNSIATVSTVVEDGIPVTTPGLQEAKTNPLENVNSSSACSTEAEGESPVSQSPVSTEHDSEIHIANGHDTVFTTEGTGGSGNTTLKEVEDSTPPDECNELHSDIGEEIYEEEGDDINQVEGLTHVNLYVQAHSKVVLILLAEEGLNNDCNSIKALWETSLNQLGELEFLVKQSSGDETTTPYSDEYSFLVYDSFERTMKGNLNELVHQVDHLFCETTKVLHEQFENCSTLKDVMLRNRSSTVYGKRNLGRGTYFHLKGSYRALQGVPSHRDPFLKLEKKASKVLNKDHSVNVF